jgi:hypothetical protein
MEINHAKPIEEVLKLPFPIVLYKFLEENKNLFNNAQLTKH